MCSFSFPFGSVSIIQKAGDLVLCIYHLESVCPEDPPEELDGSVSGVVDGLTSAVPIVSPKVYNPIALPEADEPLVNQNFWHFVSFLFGFSLPTPLL